MSLEDLSVILIKLKQRLHRVQCTLVILVQILSSSKRHPVLNSSGGMDEQISAGLLKSLGVSQEYLERAKVSHDLFVAWVIF